MQGEKTWCKIFFFILRQFEPKLENHKEFLAEKMLEVHVLMFFTKKHLKTFRAKNRRKTFWV